jgi:transcription-repair coupling factor (superfamily II helicase)
MGKTKITQPFSQSLQMQKLHDAISNSADKSSQISISGLIGSSLSILLAESFKKAEKPFLLILNDKEEAAYILNDLEQLVKETNVLFYPGSYRRPYQIEETDNANVLLPIPMRCLKRLLPEKN